MNKEKTFRFLCYHDVLENSFENGEGEHVNSYISEDIVKAETWQDALNLFFDTSLSFTFDINQININEDKNSLSYSTMVDSYGGEANEMERNMWEKEEKDLFVNHMEIFISEIVPLQLEL